ncbi:MAG: hypothetical protein LBE93_04480 [Enterobacter asburiae]|jgi:membrane-anchored protein YejM (alkaline phosphatase superfamily)|nr:hypothetical protein [Enterobacter asburiae]
MEFVIKIEKIFNRPSTLWGWLMCSAINGIAIIIVFATISYLIGIREFVWHMVVTVALLISVIYSANYFSALEARHDNRRFLLVVWVFFTVGLNLIHIWN